MIHFPLSAVRTAQAGRLGGGFFFALLFLLLLLPWAARAQAPAGGTTPSVSTILNPDGTLRPGEAGSFSATGYRMLLDPASGEPSFRPTGAGDENWQDGFGRNGVNGFIFAVARAGNGDLYVGGSFQGVGTVPAFNIAKWNGTSWSALGNGTAPVTLSNNGIRGQIFALAVLGNDLYVGGQFGTAHNASDVVYTGCIAKWDGTAWSAVGNGTSPATESNSGVSGRVHALAVLGNVLYVGGQFGTARSTTGEVLVNNVAKWNGTAWSGLGNGTAPVTSVNNGVFGSIYALAVLGNDLYVGGEFDSAHNASGAVYTRNIAKWDGTAWSGLGNGLAPATSTNNGLDNSVRALAVLGTDLYAGGGFTAAPNGNSPLLVNRVAKWDGTAWSGLGNGLAPATSTNNGLNNSVRALAVLGSDLYVGGGFTAAQNGSSIVPVNQVAKWNGTVWNGLGNGTAPPTSTTNGLDYTVNALAVIGTDLYVGGGFSAAYTSSSPVAASAIAKWNGTTWSALHTGQNGVNAAVDAVVRTSNGAFYVAGDFTSVGAMHANRIAKWDGTAWSALGNGMAPPTSTNNGVNFTVYALAIRGNDLYIGGRFTGAYSASGLLAAIYVAKWDGTSWSALGNGSAPATSTNNGVHGEVRALAVMGPDLYVGGEFTSAINGSSPVLVNRVAKWDGTVWSGLGNGTAPATATNNGLNNNALAFAVLGSDLYVGGFFTSARNGSSAVAANNVVRWNGTAWSALGNGSAPATSTNNGVDNVVLALAVMGPDLYVGGSFTAARSNSSTVLTNSIAKWDGTSWSALGNGSAPATSTNNGVNGEFREVHSLAVLDNDLYVGGRFKDVYNGSSPVLVNNIAKWNGTTWSPLGTGLGTVVSGLAVTSSRVVAGGAFSTVGDGTKVIARFGVYNIPAVLSAREGSTKLPVLHLYPNPTRSTATLRGVKPGAAVEVLDALGRVVLVVKADTTGTAQLVLPAGQSSGLYIIRSGTQIGRLVRE
ncbi:T9SS type A sorting domain-containing protein [Hymenobacter cellulosivorans]|uniref:T9SS type A sorting domain-containing protein n=1 Tax=Hymenobacter cellulosivorans TaxID=2932249 RepID=A0ABY4FCT4_9BACT|nr:T9SS type A sorting domain-containing protein [Hymenobacter cellulosivorans]UOQ54471.1 T9SS type A sorting domain-containing protein [Hymenobacter cellulosivorans]